MRGHKKGREEMGRRDRDRIEEGKEEMGGGERGWRREETGRGREGTMG